jgi:hypothetical protein
MVDIRVEGDIKVRASNDVCIGISNRSGLFNSLGRTGIDLKRDGDLLALPGRQ